MGGIRINDYERGVIDGKHTINREYAARIADLEDALRKIAAGRVDEGGCIRPLDDAMQVAHDALWPNG